VTWLGVLARDTWRGVWIYGTCRDRDAALLPTVATKLLESAGFAGLALAVADEM